MTTPKCIVCACEDVHDSEVLDAVEKGCRDLESLKRYTGLATGPCQGKTCLTLARKLLSEKAGLEVEGLGGITYRAPVQPVPLRYLAGEDEPEGGA